MMSRLIRSALPLKGEDQSLTQKNQADDEAMDGGEGNNGQSRSALLDKRMKAMNYIGSIMTQTVVELDNQFFSQCLKLILRRFRQNVKENREARTVEDAQTNNAGAAHAGQVLLRHCFM